MNEKQERSFGIIAAFLLLFTAMLAPPVSAMLAVCLLVAYVLYRVIESHRASG